MEIERVMSNNMETKVYMKKLKIASSPLIYKKDIESKVIDFCLPVTISDIRFSVNKHESINENFFIGKYPFLHVLDITHKALNIEANFVTENKNGYNIRKLNIYQHRGEYNNWYPHIIHLPTAENIIYNHLVDIFRYTVIDSFTNFDTIRGNDEDIEKKYGFDNFLNDLPTDFENAISLVNLKAFARILHVESRLYELDAINVNNDYINELYYKSASKSMKNLCYEFLRDHLPAYVYFHFKGYKNPKKIAKFDDIKYAREWVNNYLDALLVTNIEYDRCKCEEDVFFIHKFPTDITIQISIDGDLGEN